MAMTPMDIHHKEFKTSRFGGYNEEDVDSFLDLVADEFERLVQENGDLKQQMEHMKKRLAEFEEMQTSLQSALLAASKSAEAVKEQARQESETMLSKAQEESDSLMRSAQEQARQMMLAAQNDKQKIERTIGKLADVKKRYLESIKDMAETLLAQITDWETRNEGEGIVVESVSVEVPPQVMPVVPVVQEAPVAPAAPEEISSETAAMMPDEETPVVAETAAPPPPAPAAPPVSREPAAPTAKVEREPVPSPEAPVAREMREVAPPRRQTEPQAPPQRTGPEDKPAPPSSNLVDEVLAMDSSDEAIFGEFDDDDPSDEPDKGRRGRKEKRDKHFFWE